MKKKSGSNPICPHFP